MHQTTVRFGAELWDMLELEAAQSGVSVAHYVRDAALARLAYSAGRNTLQDPDERFAWADPIVTSTLRAAAEGRTQAEESSGVQAQARLARTRARRLREAARAARQIRRTSA